MQNLGLNFILNDETCAAFYRNLVRDGVGQGYAVVSALTAGDEVVATLLGIRNGSRYVMIRISNAGDKWSNCSPGRLIIERTMAALHQDGVREFDFSDRQLRLQAPLRRERDAAGRSQRGPGLARVALCIARPRRARAAKLSEDRRLPETRARQAAVTRRELKFLPDVRHRAIAGTCVVVGTLPLCPSYKTKLI